MKRLLFIAGALTLLSGCAAGPEGPAWYQQGDANYDALKAAHDACAKQGGQYQLRPGGEPTHLGDYECTPGTGA
jgi:hypothetical protein